MDSVDFAALDFFVGAIVDVGRSMFCAGLSNDLCNRQLYIRIPTMFRVLVQSVSSPKMSTLKDHQM